MPDPKSLVAPPDTSELFAITWVLLSSEELNLVKGLAPGAETTVDLDESLMLTEEKKDVRKDIPEGSFQVDLRYNGKIFQELEDDEQDDIATFDIQFAIGFRAHKEIPAAQAEQIHMVIAPLVVWPYVRQRLHDAMMAMGIPTVMLPIRQARGISGEDTSESEEGEADGDDE